MNVYVVGLCPLRIDQRALKKSPFLRTKTENVTIYNFSFYKSP